MKQRILIWAGAGFLVACCWILYLFLIPPDSLGGGLRNPMVGMLASITCPVSIAGRHFPIRFWWIPPVNAATYAVFGMIVEALRWTLHPRSAT